MKNFLDKKRKSIIFNSFELEKAYTEGIYADTPANRKLGRVGMTYSAYAEKIKKKENDTNLLYNETELNHVMNKIIKLYDMKNTHKSDKNLQNAIDEEIKILKEKREKICPNYERSTKYVDKIFDTDAFNQRGKRIYISEDCVDSVKFLLKFEGMTLSEYKHVKTEKGNYISLI